MVRPNRIKEYTFNVANLTGVGGLFNSYSDHSINGKVQKIVIFENTWAVNGSIQLYASGTVNELLWSRNGTATTSGAVYPFVYGLNNTNTTGSPQIGVQTVLNAPLRIVGSGVGTGSALGVSVVYI